MIGTGGHTAEALTLLSALDFTRYYPRTYIVSHGDTLSAKKSVTLESIKAKASTHKVSVLFLSPELLVFGATANLH